MAAFKQFNTNQVVITPFYANKNFRFNGSEITASNVGIEYYPTRQGPYVSGSFPGGFTSIVDSTLVFSNIKQLYYSNYLTSSIGDNVSTASLIPGVTSEYDSYTGIITGPRFDNFLQSSIQQNRDFAKYSSSLNSQNGPSVISIPSKLYGEKIPCSTFEFIYTSSVNYTRSFVHDDGEGNLIATQSDSSGNTVFTGSVGQIFYSQGMAIFTGGDEGYLEKFTKSVGATNSTTPSNTGNRNLDSASISFSSSITIRENQYKCTVRDNEYSYTTNPSALKPSGQLSKVKNELSSSAIGSTYGDNGDEGIYIISYLTGTGIGSKATAEVTINASGEITDITTATTGRSYLVGDNIKLDLSQLNEAGVQIIPNATGSMVFILQLKDISNYSSNLNQDENYYDFATGSYFSPYVTTVGLYNESYQLVAVGKLAQPIPISLHTDTTFIINYDT